MKKSLFELTIEEFTRVICDCPERYSVNNRYVDDNGNLHNDEIEGTYEEIIDEAIRKDDKELLEFAEKELFDYDIQIGDLEIYDYLERKTDKFEGMKLRIVERMIEDCLDDIEYDRRDYVDKMIEEGWKDYTMRKGTRFDAERKEFIEDDNAEKVIDYVDAFDKLFGSEYERDYLLNSALTIIEIKSGLHSRSLNTEGYTAGADKADCRGNDMKTAGTLNQIKNHDALPVEFSSDEAKALLGKLIKGGFCDDRFNWNKSKALLAYFAQKASDKLKLSNRMMSTGQYCVSWKPFESLFTINGRKVKNLSQASQDIVNKGNPNGKKDIDSLF